MTAISVMALAFVALIVTCGPAVADLLAQLQGASL